MCIYIYICVRMYIRRYVGMCVCVRAYGCMHAWSAHIWSAHIYMYIYTNMLIRFKWKKNDLNQNIT